MAGQWHSWGIWLRKLASEIEYELCGWLEAFLGKMAACAGKQNLVCAIWLVKGIPEANRIGYELCGWLMTFLRKLAICAGK